MKTAILSTTVLHHGTRDEMIAMPADTIDFMDVSPKQVVSVATALIPFLGNDDANRALMGANMQRQAVPLLRPQAPIIGTGMEYKAAVDSGVVIIAPCDGVIKKASASRIEIISDEDGSLHTYDLIKFKRSNQGTCINQRVIVKVGGPYQKRTTCLPTDRRRTKANWRLGAIY